MEIVKRILYDPLLIIECVLWIGFIVVLIMSVKLGLEADKDIKKFKSK